MGSVETAKSPLPLSTPTQRFADAHDMPLNQPPLTSVADSVQGPVAGEVVVTTCPNDPATHSDDVGQDGPVRPVSQLAFPVSVQAAQPPVGLVVE